MNLLKNKTIAIIGGGPGGLTLARLLQIQGADVKVYERDTHKDARQQGATLDLHYESGLRALREAGLMDAFRANYRPGADRMRITDKHANIKFEDAFNNDELGERDRPEIDRGPLQNILLNSLQPSTVVWGSHITGLKQTGDTWQVEFKNGTTISADIVIGADGANSKIRPYITPIKPFYAGVTVIEGAVYHSAEATSRIHELLNGGKIFALNDEKTLVVSSKGDGSLVFYTGCKTDENWVRNCGIDFTDKAQVLAWFKAEFAGWDSIWLELFENASGSFTPRPQYCMPLDQTWQAQPNITMLGDAAHLMPPFAGEGVNMAMLDAVELSEQLTSNTHPDLQTAIAAYEHQMRARASETAKETMINTDALHAPDALEFMVNLIS
ncbi:FAD-dependent oxidoreductase [Mucilaginibacter jinjuensis]|uniref:Flavin-dependent monooxygenase n=1 Tax=Mucilaginibacter jinjuensis TaxID=1176721 RepID=A0ABY7T338_9SPHI|nr:NAD(P)/FAD-dependent oxidoreductase [Mucilaginibacter jinjuensis]WCT10860.1 NAD(P)/FAD-dependent oxidoreductase [Mucilaginibacter jinjuensis]